MIGRRAALGLLAAAALAGCAVINAPLNAPREAGDTPTERARPGGDETLWVGLAFSGGGMRASAFAHGVVEELRAMTARPGDPDGILSELRLVTGVSGGSVTAAYYGLNGAAGVDGYRDGYLVQDGERYMKNNPLNPVTLARGISGGANGRETFGRFLDETLFHGATFGDLARRSSITTWINATDVASQTTFLFTPETFDALCSDLSRFPISDAVAASAAYPLVFSPIVIDTHQGACTYHEPDWLTAARHNSEATGAMRAHAAALESYASDPDMKYVKLLDGGITDNFGTTGLAVERARAEAPHAPLTAREAVKLSRLLFLVADAGVEQPNGWTHRLKGPGGGQLARSIVMSAMTSASRTGYDAMRLQLDKWQEDLVEFRCGLSLPEVARLRGSLAGWDCRDLKFFTGLVRFDDLDPEMEDRLNAIPTRLRLEEEEVDLSIRAGRETTRQNPEVNGFLASTERYGTDRLSGIDRARRISPLGAKPVKTVAPAHP
ncbi:patatin-like phospholipase family protein [Oceanicola sp. S124]|uniref:patatin-like phospholipase family protein n=1 Tax=Oceanicola sp. S124 TaxID=1042378 RepID=UPI0002557AB4|nr:patatin-like phospholipase family protein [Oceanicola sp. S124]